MPVYIDPLLNHGGSRSFRWQQSCHLFADTEQELHEFAARIGLRRAWFQSYRAEFPHYDLTAARREQARLASAIEVTRQQMVEWVRWRRARLRLERELRQKQMRRV